MKNNDFKDFDISNFIELTEDQLRFEVNGGSKKSSSSSSSSSSRSNSSSSRGSSSSNSRGSSSTSTSKQSSSSTSTATGSSGSGRSNTSQSSGSREVANTNHAVANARPGDTITRNNGTRVTLTQGDINYAKAHDNTPTSVPTSSPAQTTATTDRGIKTSGKSWSSGSSGSSSSNSSSSYGSYVGYSGNGSGSRDSSEQAIMNAARHDPDYKEAQNKGTAMPINRNASTGGATNPAKKNTNTYKYRPEKSNGKSTDSRTKITDSIHDNWIKPYNYDTGYRCDNWVEEVLDDAGFISSNYLSAGKASEKTVAEHITSLKANKKEGEDYTKTMPKEDGAYVVFMGDGQRDGKAVSEHAAIMVVKDSVATMYDNSSGNGINPVYKTDSLGNFVLNNKGEKVVSYYEQGVGATPELVAINNNTKIDGWCYDSFYFQKIQ